MRRLRRILITLVVLLLLGPVSFWLGLYFLQDVFLYNPLPLPADTTPETFGLPYEEVWITTDDGVRLFAWWVPAPTRSPAQAPALLWLHGNGGHVAGRLPRLVILREHVDASVLLVDYRGYGRSEGAPSEAGLLADAAAAFRYLEERPGLDPSRIVLYGRSLGGAVATQQALREPCAGLILESTFASIPAMAEHRFPLVPFVREVARTGFDTLGSIPRLTVPLLSLHGTADRTVPLAQGRAVFAAAGSADKTFVELPGVNHHDSHERGGERYYGALRDFVARVAPTAAEAGD